MTLKPASAPVRKSVEHNVAASELVVYKMVANERGATFANVLGLFYFILFFFHPHAFTGIFLFFIWICKFTDQPSNFESLENYLLICNSSSKWYMSFLTFPFCKSISKIRIIFHIYAFLNYKMRLMVKRENINHMKYVDNSVVDLTLIPSECGPWVSTRSQS